MFSIACPNCQGSIENDPALAGQIISCPHCKKQIKMPKVAPVRVAKPPVMTRDKPSVAAGQGFPNIEPTAKTTSTVGSRYKKRKQKKPVWFWIVLLVCSPFLCCVGLMPFTVLDEAINGEANRKEYRREQQRLEAELPDDSTGHQWVKASREAKLYLIKRVGPSWTKISHSDILEHVDYRFKDAPQHSQFPDHSISYFARSLDDLVRDVIAQYEKNKDDADDDWRRDHWIRRANETNDPAEHQEYLRRARENSR